MIRRPPRSTLDRSSAASDVYKRQTVAGVLLAFTIPVSSRINTKKFKTETENLLKDFDNAGEHGEDVLTNSERLSIVDQIENNCEKILTPLQRFEHGLHPLSLIHISEPTRPY